MGEVFVRGQSLNQLMAIIAETWLINERVQLAVQRASGLDRLRGLIARRPAARTALRLPNCHSVHSFGMRRAIDVVFVDRDGRVIDARTLPPRRFASCRGAAEAFELADGEAAAIGLDQSARLSRAPETPGAMR